MQLTRGKAYDSTERESEDLVLSNKAVKVRDLGRFASGLFEGFVRIFGLPVLVVAFYRQVQVKARWT